MDYAIINVPAAPIRRKPSHRKEMVNQLLFGESVIILKTKDVLWVKVRSLHDDYEGWTTSTLLQEVDEKTAAETSSFASSELISAVTINNQTIQIPVGSSLPFYNNGRGRVGNVPFQFPGIATRRDATPFSPEVLKKLVIPWLNAPYLWGGRTPLGVDCSGFVQVIYKLMGKDLPRDAWQQAQQGEPVKFRDIRPGDLAFFDNKEDIVHVGILLGDEQIIHASGKVKIDRINKKGIVNEEKRTRPVRLKAIRRVL